MFNFVRRLRKLFSFIGFVLFGAVAFVTTVTLKHLVDTPQPLESVLPGEARLYRWRSQHIFYKEMGAPELPPMVLLHNPGLGASAFEMRSILAKLATRYHVYAPDLPGFGLSDRPHSDYTVATYTTFCHDFLTEVVSDAARHPAVLLASGLSCAYAVDVAHRFPNLCERLILISPVSLFGTIGRIRVPRVLLPLLRVSTFGLVAYAICSTRAALRLLLAARAPHTRGEQAKAELDYLYAATHRFGAEHAPLALWRGQLSQQQEATNQFEELRQPTLIIWGAQALQNTRFNASEHHISMNSQLAIMRDAGIYVHEQYPDVVITDIVDWDDSWDNG